MVYAYLSLPKTVVDIRIVLVIVIAKALVNIRLV